jgi:hypothetical protein
MSQPQKLSAFGKQYQELIDKIVNATDSNEKFILQKQLAQLIEQHYKKGTP